MKVGRMATVSVEARAPMRISLGGGGTDLPSYYLGRSGYFVAMAINLYARVSLVWGLRGGGIRQYFGNECDESVQPGGLKDAMTRNALLRLVPKISRLEIRSCSDVVPGTGLGSSGAYLVAISQGLLSLRGSTTAHEPGDVAECAFAIEAHDSGRNVGKQDHFVAAWGGLREYAIRGDGAVTTSPLPFQVAKAVSDRLVLFQFGDARDAGMELMKRRVGAKGSALMDEISEIGRSTGQALGAGRVDEWAGLLHEHWIRKLRMFPSTINIEFDALYRHYRQRFGATGAKLLGAAGGGFGVICIPGSAEKRSIRAALQWSGYPVLDFSPVPQGSWVRRSNDDRGGLLA